jgi:ubiquinone/menaquinone biosynthesis C-methylase UbiE
MTSSIAAVQAYWDAYTKDLRVPGTEWGSPQFFSAIKSQHDQAYAVANRILNLDAVSSRSLLELGCGIGLDTVEFARHGAQVTAIDASAVSLELAKRLLAYHRLTASLVFGNAEDLPFPPAAFDIVVARGILMFTPNESRLIDQIFRVLKPGGEANILLHNRFSWYVLLARLSGANLVHPSRDPSVNRLHTNRSARRLFADFSRVHVYSDRFPTKTPRAGSLAPVYNSLVVPLAQRLPRAMLNPFGYYLIIKAIK